MPPNRITVGGIGRAHKKSTPRFARTNAPVAIMTLVAVAMMTTRDVVPRYAPPTKRSTTKTIAANNANGQNLFQNSPGT
jgi:hypothetical protein